MNALQPPGAHRVPSPLRFPTRIRRIAPLPAALAFSAILALVPASAAAQTGGGFDLRWTSPSAGTLAAGGPYKLASSIGAPVATPREAIQAPSGFALTGGFLQDASVFPVPVAISAFAIE